MPEPARNRLANRHEYVLHLAPRQTYYYDLFGYAQEVANGANPGDVWHITPRRHMGEHLAPFPTEIARRAIPSHARSTCARSVGSRDNGSFSARRSSIRGARRRAARWSSQPRLA